MKKTLVFSLFIFSLYSVTSQNLVPNPGFEIYSATNDTVAINAVLGQPYSTGYYIPNDHLCYYFLGRYCLDWHGPVHGILRNRCWDSLGYMDGKLTETLRFENAYDTAHLTHSGMSCANLFIRDSPNPSSYIYTSLKDTLCESCEYDISFYVYVTKASNVIFNNIGLVFKQDLGRDIQWDRSEEAAKFFLKSNEPLKQGVWQKVHYRYVAKGYESSILISKYKSKVRIKVLRKNEQDYAMSIYIDDIVIEKVVNEFSYPQN
jgi:hypothetical protein